MKKILLSILLFCSLVSVGYSAPSHKDVVNILLELSSFKSIARNIYSDEVITFNPSTNSEIDDCVQLTNHCSPLVDLKPKVYSCLTVYIYVHGAEQKKAWTNIKAVIKSQILTDELYITSYQKARQYYTVPSLIITADKFHNIRKKRLEIYEKLLTIP